MNITTSITLNMQTPGYVVAYEPQGNKLSRLITATLKNGSANWSVPSGATAMIRVAKPDGTFAVYDKNEKGQTAYTISGNTVTIELVGAALAAAGDALVTVMFLDSTGSNLSPFSFRLIIMPSAVSDDDIVSSDYFNIFQETIDSIQQMLTETQAMYGSPMTAATASAMTNTSKIYVYVGAESGYSYGHWYYYNGSAWVDGGIYNSEGINSNWIYEAFFTGAIENTSLAHFTDGADNVPVKALTVAINPVQSGTGDPSPDNVRPITGWTECNVARTGVNIWDEEWERGDIAANGKPLSKDDRIRTKNYIPCVPDMSYYVIDPTSGNNIKLFFYDSRKAYLGSTPWVGNSIITTPTNARFFKFITAISYGTAYNNDISINYPSTDHDYHSYTGETYSIEFPSEAGTVYGGTLTHGSNGSYELTVDRAMVDLGTLAWSYSSSGSYFFSVALRGICKGVNDGICSAYTVGTTSASNLPDKHFCIDTSANNAGIVYVKDSRYTTAANFKAAVSGVQLVYPLVTEQTYTITGQEVLTMLGTNNIWADTGEIEELIYRADSSLYLDSKINASKSIIAGIETSMVATKSYSIGDLLIVGDVLYKVASPIASGAAFTPGTNVNATTVAEQLILLANS